jgi:hypothetical protein
MDGRGNLENPFNPYLHVGRGVGRNFSSLLWQISSLLNMKQNNCYVMILSPIIIGQFKFFCRLCNMHLLQITFLFQFVHVL